LYGMRRISQRHVAVAMMVAVGLAIRGDVDELSPGAGIREPTSQPLRELLATLQQLLKSHGLGDRAIVKEQINPASGWQTGKVGARGIDFPAAYVPPASSTQLARPGRLALGKNGEFDAKLREDLQRLYVNRCFRQP